MMSLYPQSLSVLGQEIIVLVVGFDSNNGRIGECEHEIKRSRANIGSGINNERPPPPPFLLFDELDKLRRAPQSVQTVFLLLEDILCHLFVAGRSTEIETPRRPATAEIRNRMTVGHDRKAPLRVGYHLLRVSEQARCRTSPLVFHRLPGPIGRQPRVADLQKREEQKKQR